jgi:uncharacterized membrane protein
MAATDNPYIAPTILNQELERLKFAQNLRRDPGAYSAYVNTRVDEMTKEIFERKRAAFQKAQIDLSRYMDMDHNANFYKSRSADVDRLSASIEQNNKRMASGVIADKDITRRQFEINEWANYNKMETLFFLQIALIAALSGAIILYFQKNGALTNAMASLLYAILAVIVGGTGLYRYFYTNRTRDPRLWHRRYFGGATPPEPALKCAGDGPVEFDINTIIPKEVTQCADSAQQNFEKWQENMKEEIYKYQTQGTRPAGAGICTIAE